MKSKYFTVEVKPTIAASKQALAAFADGDLLFDWTSFQIPRGPAKLVNATIVSPLFGSPSRTILGLIVFAD